MSHSVKHRAMCKCEDLKKKLLLQQLFFLLMTDKKKNNSKVCKHLVCKTE